jgi:recombination protein RecT
MSSAVTTTQTPKTLKAWLQTDTIKSEIAKVLPKHMTAERMARVAINALTRTPKLNECTQESFFRCLLDLSQWGLEPNGRDAHLIPYGKECTLILDYKGLATLAYRSGKVKLIHSDVIREGDIFFYSLGEVREHVSWAWRTDAEKPEQPGKVIGAYCLVKMEGDVVKCEVMTMDEVLAIKSRSRSGNSGPWQTDFNEMAKKTVFRRVSKWLPLSPELVDAMQKDDDRIVEGVVQSSRTITRAAPIAIGVVDQVDAAELQQLVDGDE